MVFCWKTVSRKKTLSSKYQREVYISVLVLDIQIYCVMGGPLMIKKIRFLIKDIHECAVKMVSSVKCLLCFPFQFGKPHGPVILV